MKERELDIILKYIELGFSKKTIREKLSISITVLSNRLRKLENLGLIKRTGKYQIESLRSSRKHPRVTKTYTKKTLNKRGHAYNFKIQFPSENNILKKESIKNFINKKPNINKKTGKPYKDKRNIKILNFGSISFKYKKYTIWINKKSLTIYSNNSYYSQDALHAKFTALKDINNLISYFKQKLELNGIFGIEIFREHYGLIFNDFAKWILDKGMKLDIKNEKNKSILWVDDSREDDIGLKEKETDNPLMCNKIDKYYKDQIKTNWDVTPSFLLEAFDKVRQNLELANNEILNLKQENNLIKSKLELNKDDKTNIFLDYIN